MKNKHLKILIFLGLYVSVTGCIGGKEEKQRQEQESIEILPEVIFAEADAEPLQFFIESRGVTEPIQKIPLIPRVSGFVEQFAIIAGRHVSEGELLLQLDDKEWDLSTQEAYNKYLKAKSEYDVEINLRQRDGRTGNGTDGYRITTGLADAELAYEKAKLNLSYTKITAPFSGVIATKEVISNGAYISAGRELGELINTARMRIRFDLLESEISSVETGMNVELHDPSGDAFEGRIVAISPQIDQRTKTGQAIVEVDNRSGRLKTGMTVEGKVYVRSASGKVRMPRSALLERDGRTLVFKLHGKEVEWIYVTPEAMNSQWVIINHEDINPGDTLAVDKHFSISHQQKVIPMMVN